MGQISILHISDIHYFTDLNTSDPLSGEVPSGLEWKNLDLITQKRVSPHLIRTIKQSIFDQIEEMDFESIVISGDLCFKGSLEAYRSCLEYIDLQFHKFDKIDKSKVIITAGNHDIYTKFTPEKPETKFQSFCNLLSEYGFNEYSLYNPNFYSVVNETGKILLIDVNTCFNFGDIVYHPEFLKQILKKCIRVPKGITGESQINNYIVKKLREEWYGLLDIPYVEVNQISNICTKMDEKSDYFPVIIGHHNLLPMRYFLQDRPYNSIINGGQIREKLLLKKRIMLYLHGHIHDDPLEGIIAPDEYIFNEQNDAKIICSASPTLFPLPKADSNKFGFNIVTIHFSNCNEKIPLGCDIIYFYLKNGSIHKKVKRIHFHDSIEALKYLNDTEMKLLRKINRLTKSVRLKDLHKELTDSEQLDLDIKQFNDEIEFLYWLKLIQLFDNPRIELREIKKVLPC